MLIILSDSLYEAQVITIDYTENVLFLCLLIDLQ